jgi:hypothetical protein
MTISLRNPTSILHLSVFKWGLLLPSRIIEFPVRKPDYGQELWAVPCVWQAIAYESFESNTVPEGSIPDTLSFIRSHDDAFVCRDIVQGTAS